MYASPAPSTRPWSLRFLHPREIGRRGTAAMAMTKMSPPPSSSSQITSSPSPTSISELPRRSFIRRLLLISSALQWVPTRMGSASSGDLSVYKAKSGVIEFEVPVEAKYGTLYDRAFKPENPGALVFLNSGEKIVIGKWRHLDPSCCRLIEGRVKEAMANSDPKSAALKLAPILHGSDEEATAAFSVDEAVALENNGLRYTFSKAVCNGIVKSDPDNPGGVICLGVGNVQRPVAARYRYARLWKGESCFHGSPYDIENDDDFCRMASTVAGRWESENTELSQISQSLRLNPAP
eukprot:jgi/Bigna1/77706/fgenesh1_pg.49_\